MNRKGFIFWDILIGLSLMGFIVLMCFPILASGGKIYRSTKIHSETNYLGEYIFERLNSHDDYCEMILRRLKEGDELSFEDLEDYYLDRYDCKLVSCGDNPYLLEIELRIYSKKENESCVEFKGSIPK